MGTAKRLDEILNDEINAMSEADAKEIEEFLKDLPIIEYNWSEINSPEKVNDALTYRFYRDVWAIRYKYLSQTIRNKKSLRSQDSAEYGYIESKIAKARQNDLDSKIIKRYEKSLRKNHMNWWKTNTVCLSLSSEARRMMEELEEVKSKRPPKKAAE